jgi:hypothetical protein
MLPPDVSVLQQPVLSLDMSSLHKPVLQPELPLDVSVLYSSLCCLWTYLFYSRLCYLDVYIN